MRECRVIFYTSRKHLRFIILATPSTCWARPVRRGMFQVPERRDVHLATAALSVRGIRILVNG